MSFTDKKTKIQRRKVSEVLCPLEGESGLDLDLLSLCPMDSLIGRKMGFRDAYILLPRNMTEGTVQMR